MSETSCNCFLVSMSYGFVWQNIHWNLCTTDEKNDSHKQLMDSFIYQYSFVIRVHFCLQQQWKIICNLLLEKLWRECFMVLLFKPPCPWNGINKIWITARVCFLHIEATESSITASLMGEYNKNKSEWKKVLLLIRKGGNQSEKLRGRSLMVVVLSYFKSLIFILPR